jgi:hypothetical protein
MAQKKLKKKKSCKRKDQKNKEKLIKLGFIIIAIILVLIIYKIYRAVASKTEKIDLSGQSYYQYFYGIMEEYSGDMEISKQDDGTILTLENDEIIYLDSTPIYYKDVLGKALLPEEMELVIPNTGMYRIAEFTSIFQENQKIYAKRFNKEKTTALENAFLYDGKDLYFFLDETRIAVGDQEYIVSPLSYAIVNYRTSVEIYNYESDEYTIIQDESALSADVIARNEAKGYSINLSVDSITTQNGQQLLMSNLSNLSDLDY